MSFLNVSDTLQNRPMRHKSLITIKSHLSASKPRLFFTIHRSIISAAQWEIPIRLTVDFNPTACALRLRYVPDDAERSWKLTMPDVGRARLNIPIGEGFPLPPEPIFITDAYELRDRALYLYISDETPLFGVSSLTDKDLDHAQAYAYDIKRGLATLASCPEHLHNAVVRELAQ